MKNKYSKRYKKLIEMSKDAKTSKIEDVIGKVKKIVPQNLTSL